MEGKMFVCIIAVILWYFRAVNTSIGNAENANAGFS